MIAFIGSDINLGLFLSRNNQPLTAQNVTVRVVDQNSGAELLASTVVPELGEPGTYNFLWQTTNPTPPPAGQSDLLALFSARSRTFPQVISVRPKGDNIFSAKDTIKATAKSSDVKGSVQSDENRVFAGVSGNDQLKGSITQDTLIGTADGSDNTKGKIDDDDVNGRLKGC